MSVSPKLNIVADAHIWGVRSAFSSIPGFDVDLSVLENGEITRETLKETDILLTRSSTQVDARLLEGTAVRFAATATIGDDHYDKAWLEQNSIAWANAAGSSTGSVIEYMMTALIELHALKLISLPDITLGIIGVGRIGSALADVCSGLDIQLLLNDPPRERLEGEEGFSSIDSVLSEADVVTLHTPLLKEGDDRTFHLIDSEWLSRFQGRGIINAARGGCVDNKALLTWLDGDAQRFAVLDCWEGEPDVLKTLLAHPQMIIATPHIAGHSLDGKAANTQYVYQALCRYLGVEPVWSMEEELPAIDPTECEDVDHDLWQGLSILTTALYPIMRDNQVMKDWLGEAGNSMAKAFSSFRRNYPVRRAWESQQIKAVNASEALISHAQKIGIDVRN
ncbi:MAG: 4-phosphoerythronate dehydrogenase [Mariprofundaceae bacterium]